MLWFHGFFGMHHSSRGSLGMLSSSFLPEQCALRDKILLGPPLLTVCHLSRCWGFWALYGWPFRYFSCYVGATKTWDGVWAEIFLKPCWSRSFKRVLVICAVDWVSLICVLDLFFCCVTPVISRCFPNPHIWWSWHAHPYILEGVTSQIVASSYNAPISFSLQVMPLCWSHLSVGWLGKCCLLAFGTVSYHRLRKSSV